jgi:hypothetical protein
MVLFKKDSFPISVTLPRGEIITAPSLLTIDSQRRMRMVYKTFILSTETPFFEEVLAPPGMEISNKNARAAFTNASRLQGILVPYEAMRRLATIGAFLQRSESYYHFNAARRNCNQVASLNDKTVNIFLKRRKIYDEGEEAAPATHWTRLSNVYNP